MRYPPRLPRASIEVTPNPLNLSSSASKEGSLNIYGGEAGVNPLTIRNGATAMFTFNIDNTKLILNADIEFTGSQKITTTANGNLILLPNGTGITIVGDAAATSHSLAANDDFLVTGKLEVDGHTYFDSYVTCGHLLTMGDDKASVWGTDSDVHMDFSADQATESTLVLALGDTAKSIIITNYTNRNQDFDHAGQTNPVIFVHSAKNPDTDNTEWISIFHDQTNGVIACGSGMLNLTGPVLKYPVKLETHTPSAANDTGVAGTICADAAYIYVCVGTDEWERVAIASW